MIKTFDLNIEDHQLFVETDAIRIPLTFSSQYHNRTTNHYDNIGGMISLAMSNLSNLVRFYTKSKKIIKLGHGFSVKQSRHVTAKFGHYAGTTLILVWSQFFSLNEDEETLFC